MKILLVAINAKYIHSNLAVYCLKAYAEKNMPQNVNVQIELAEYTINQNRDEILKDIYSRDDLFFMLYLESGLCGVDDPGCKKSYERCNHLDRGSGGVL